MNDDRNQQIRDRAYKIWQDAGEPHGRDQEHWDQASSEIGESISVTGEPEDPDAGESGPAASDTSDAGTVPAIGSPASSDPAPGATPTGAKPGKSA